DTGTIEAMRDHYATLLASATASPDTPISELAMVTPEELEQLDASGQGPVDEMVSDAVAAMIERQAALTPDAVAVRDGASSLTYAELSQRSSRLARTIAQRVGAGATIGIVMRPTVNLITALLAVLKSGNAYVPIDVATPKRRAVGMLADADVAFV